MNLVVLHHGLLGFDRLRLGPIRYNNWRGIDAAIRSRGFSVATTRVHPTACISTRATQLVRQVQSLCHKHAQQHHTPTANTTATKCYLIAHSMGGLDARHAITHLGLHQHIAGLLTISTPHRGSSFADACALKLGRDLGLYHLLAKLGLDLAAALDLTTESCATFNARTPNMPGVTYASVGASAPAAQLPPALLPSHRYIFKQEGDNDGLVSVSSAKWGTDLGIWPADHFHCINKRGFLSAKRPSILPLYLAALDGLTALNK